MVELEKFKFVLDYKIKELKKQIEPLNMEILEMRGQIKEMDGELERYSAHPSSSLFFVLKLIKGTTKRARDRTLW